MKKILTVLLALTMVLSFAACNRNGDDNGTTDKNTSDTGSSSVSDSTAKNDSSTSKVSPDESTSKTDSTSGTSQAPSNGKETTTKDKTTNSKPDIGNNIDKNTLPKDSYLYKYVIDILSGDSYTCTVATDTDGEKVVADITKSGENYAVDAKVQNVQANIIYKDGKIICCMPSKGFIDMLTENMDMAGADEQTKQQMKALTQLFSGSKGFYYEIANEEAGPTGYENVLDMLSVFDGDNLTFVKRTNVTKDGKKYVCEEYKTEDGITKYYYEGTDLRIIETVDSGNVTSIVEISNLSSEIDTKALEIPKGYADLTVLMGQLG